MSYAPQEVMRDKFEPHIRPMGNIATALVVVGQNVLENSLGRRIFLVQKGVFATRVFLQKKVPTQNVFARKSHSPIIFISEKLGDVWKNERSVNNIIIISENVGEVWKNETSGNILIVISEVKWNHQFRKFRLGVKL